MRTDNFRALNLLLAMSLFLVFCSQPFAATINNAKPAAKPAPEKTDAQPAFTRSGNVAPIPPAESALPTITATPLLNVDKNPHTLEGVRFGPDGFVYFCDVSGRRILRMDPKTRKFSPIVEFADFRPSGIAFHPRDGRLFFCGSCRHGGGIFAMNKDHSSHSQILKLDAGYQPNDLLFDADGGIYFTDFKGHLTNPAGGAYYISPDFKEVKKVVGNIANANGIALAPKGDVLWISEYGGNRLFRVELEHETEIDRIHSYPVYTFTGAGGPDSIRTDSEGNIYAPMMGQGRVLIFNQLGYPIGQILLPEREKGHNLFNSSLDIDPNSRDLYIVARDDKGYGANVFKSEGFANGKGLQSKVDEDF